MPAWERDPASVLFDRPARALLGRARAARGEWQGTRLADPSANQRAVLGRMGIDVDARDRPSAIAGRARAGQGLDAKTRWARSFVRAVYYINDRRHGGPGLALEIQVGRHKTATPNLPPGRAVRMRVRRGGSVARRAVQAKADSQRIYASDGSEGDRWSDPRKRDWG